MIHTVTIDLTAPGIGVLVTPGRGNWPEEYTARTTSEFLKEFKLQVAINGSFFYPFHEKGPFDYYPHSGVPVNLLGQGISNGVSYSPSKPNWPVLCVAANNRAQIRQKSCPKGTLQGLSGSDILVERGAMVPLTDLLNQDNKLYPRRLLLMSAARKCGWLLLTGVSLTTARASPCLN